MIRTDCPNCRKGWDVDVSRAGTLDICPHCQQTFRIPATLGPKDHSPFEPDEPAESPFAEPVSDLDRPPSAPVPTAQYFRDEKPAAVPWVLPVAEKTSSRNGNRRYAREENGRGRYDDDFSRPRDFSRRNRNETAASSSLIPGISNYLFVLLGLGVIWLVLGGISFIKPELSLIPIGFGALVMIVASLWLLVKAGQDGVLWLLGCFFLPTALLYVFTHLKRTWKPVLTHLAGVAVLVTGVIIQVNHEHSSSFDTFESTGREFESHDDGDSFRPAQGGPGSDFNHDGEADRDHPGVDQNMPGPEKDQEHPGPGTDDLKPNPDNNLIPGPGNDQDKPSNPGNDTVPPIGNDLDKPKPDNDQPPATGNDPDKPNPGNDLPFPPPGTDPDKDKPGMEPPAFPPPGNDLDPKIPGIDPKPDLPDILPDPDKPTLPPDPPIEPPHPEPPSPP